MLGLEYMIDMQHAYAKFHSNGQTCIALAVTGVCSWTDSLSAPRMDPEPEPEHRYRRGARLEARLDSGRR